MSRFAILLSVLLMPLSGSYAEDGEQNREPASVETEEPIIIDMGDRAPNSQPSETDKSGADN